jgi:hypothetical protein
LKKRSKKLSMKEINKDKLVRRYMHKLIFNIKSIPISAGHPE